MSDPRYTDPRNFDSRRPLDPDDAGPRLRDPELPSDDGGRAMTWAWMAGIAVVVVVLALAFGHRGTDEAGVRPTSNPPTTTGAAPARPQLPQPTGSGSSPAPAAPAQDPNPAEPAPR
jgi:hypothetical protein